MSCKLCKQSAQYKVANFCVSCNDTRYEYYCGDCLIKKFSKPHCSYQDKCQSAVIIGEFEYINAYWQASLLAQRFGYIQEQQSVYCEGTSDDFPYSLIEDPSNKLYKFKKVYLYVKVDNKRMYLNVDVNSQWNLFEEKDQFFLAMYKKGDNKVRFFLGNQHLRIKSEEVSLKRTTSNDVSKVSKFVLCNLNEHRDLPYVKFMDDKKECYLFFDEKPVTVGKKNRPTIMWEEYKE